MVFHPISRDVKLAAIRLHERGLLDVSDILSVCNFSRSTFYRILKLLQETGDVVKPQDNSKRGRPRILDREDTDYLLQLVHQKPDYFLDELLSLLRTNRFISVHYSLIHRELERMGMSYKKLKKIATERNEGLRADFMARMAQYDPHHLGFIDETSKDERTLSRRYGRAKSGKRAQKKQVFVRGRRTSTCALLTLDGMAAGMAVEGSVTHDKFMEWLEYDVLPKCQAYPGPLSVLVMDNARIHHGDDVIELADRFGVRIEYLPPYSPDLNPIEEAFSKIKHWLRRYNEYYRATTDDGIIFDMLEVLDIITVDDAHGYFIHAGYF